MKRITLYIIGGITSTLISMEILLLMYRPTFLSPEGLVIFVLTPIAGVVLTCAHFVHGDLEPPSSESLEGAQK